MTVTVPCSACKRPIREGSPYFARKKGPKCGGRIRRSRKPATAPTPVHLPVGAAFEVDPDQLELFVVVPVAVTR